MNANGSDEARDGNTVGTQAVATARPRKGSRKSSARSSAKLPLAKSKSKPSARSLRPPTTAEGLTLRELRFIEGYIGGATARDAYLAAGFRARGNAADSGAARLLTRVRVAKAIEDARARALDSLGVTTAMVVAELAKVAFNDARRMFRDDGTLKSIHELDPHTAAAIASITVETDAAGPGDENAATADDDDAEAGGSHGTARRRGRPSQRGSATTTTKVRTLDKLKALEILGRHLGMFEKRVVVSGDPSSPISHRHGGSVRQDVEVTVGVGVDPKAMLAFLNDCGLPVPGEPAALADGGPVVE